MQWGGLKLGKWQKYLSKVGINTLKQKSGRKGEFPGIQSQRRLRHEGKAERSDTEKQPDKAWTTYVGKVVRLSGTQQAQARRKSFRSGYYSCN